MVVVVVVVVVVEMVVVFVAPSSKDEVEEEHWRLWSKRAGRMKTVKSHKEFIVTNLDRKT